MFLYRSCGLLKKLFGLIDNAVACAHFDTGGDDERHVKSIGSQFAMKNGGDRKWLQRMAEIDGVFHICVSCGASRLAEELHQM